MQATNSADWKNGCSFREWWGGNHNLLFFAKSSISSSGEQLQNSETWPWNPLILEQILCGMEVTSFLLNPFSYEFFLACLHPGKGREGGAWCRSLNSTAGAGSEEIVLWKREGSTAQPDNPQHSDHTAELGLWHPLRYSAPASLGFWEVKQYWKTKYYPLWFNFRLFLVLFAPLFYLFTWSFKTIPE